MVLKYSDRQETEGRSRWVRGMGEMEGKKGKGGRIRHSMAGEGRG
jgi:hypothetical protein